MTPLEVARRSPELVGRHDLDGWLALFTEDAEVHDPVGGPAHPRGALEAFWRIFIADNRIRFEEHLDVVDGAWVYRDVTIHTTLSTGVVLKVPAILRYEVVGHRIRRLHAHWELGPMILQTMLLGPLAWWASTLLFLRMFRFMGLGGTWAYLMGLRGVGASGRRRIEAEAGAPLTKVLVSGEHVIARTAEGFAHLGPEGFRATPR